MPPPLTCFNFGQSRQGQGSEKFRSAKGYANTDQFKAVQAQAGDELSGLSKSNFAPEGMNTAGKQATDQLSGLGLAKK
jgi:hypothetical protein